jgi:phosphatidylinositol alpha-1,6-mannosyltransferase
VSGRALVVTPGIGGADGIAAVSRLVARALDPPGPVAVLALDGAAPAPRPARRPRFLAAALRAAVAAPPARVICLHVGLGAVARALAGRRAPLAIFLHGVEAWRPLGRLARWAITGAGVLIANSEHTVRRFRAANPDLAGRAVSVCHLGVAPAPASVADGDPAGAPFALIVGRMAAAERYKGHDLLLDIWPGVARDVPGARLVIAGDGDDRARLEARAARLGDHVRFVGRVSDATLASLYRRCAFFAMPSRDEGFGLVFLEAMRAGRACIGGTGAAAEVIEDEVTGLVVDPGARDAVHKAIVRLFLEPETCERMGCAGAARLAERFTEPQFRRRFRQIIGLPDAPELHTDPDAQASKTNPDAPASRRERGAP